MSWPEVRKWRQQVALDPDAEVRAIREVVVEHPEDVALIRALRRGGEPEEEPRGKTLDASGGWFWWGAHGPQPYLMLWRLLYDRLVNHHQLHNLIWVWNGQHRDWYPGDPYVDVVSEDIYDTERDHGPQEAAYAAATGYSSVPKLVALSETGALLDPARLASSTARWSWFNLWSGDFARAQTWNEDSMKRQVYASDFVVTLDELPSFEE